MRNLNRLTLLTSLLTLMISANSWAAKTDGFALVGDGKLKVLFWDVYRSALYTPTGEFNADTDEYILEITYLQNIENDHLIDQTYKQWEHLGVDEENYLKYSDQLELLWPDVSKGDSLTMHVTPEQTSFYFNSDLTGTINSAEFGPMFSAIWLSPNSSQPKLRKKLLGGI